MNSPSFNFNIEDISKVAAQILTQAFPDRIFLFYGEMGAGKTTLIKALCKQLGAEGPCDWSKFTNFDL